MSRAARLLWVAAVTAGLCLVGLAVISKGTLEPQGMLIFDSRVFGYTPQTARRYLAALESLPQGRATYLGIFRQLDTVFPVLLTIAIGGAIWRCAQGLSRAFRSALLLIPLGYLATDLMENALVAQMLRAGVSVSDAAVLQASARTQIKWTLLAASLLVLVLLWRTKWGTAERRNP